MYMSTEQVRHLLQFNLFTKDNKTFPVDGSEDLDTGSNRLTCNFRNFDLKLSSLNYGSDSISFIKGVPWFWMQPSQYINSQTSALSSAFNMSKDFV